MIKKKEIPPYRVINWDFNHDGIEYYDVMPYLVSCWDEEKKNVLNYNKNLKRRKKTMAGSPDIELVLKKMPETFKDIKNFVNDKCFYQFHGRCEYECIVTGWPIQKKDHKMDVYEQIEANLDVVTKHFMDYIKGE